MMIGRLPFLKLFVYINIVSTVVSQQEAYCNYKTVIKARIVEPGTILQSKVSSRPDKPNPGKAYRVLEFFVVNIFKTNEVVPLESTLWYAVTKKTGNTSDVDGIKKMNANPVGDEYLFLFDDWRNIRLYSTSIPWLHVKSFQRTVLKEEKYDCACQFDNCYNRVTRLTGRVGRKCGDLNFRDLACFKDADGKCVWKGSKSTCVNPNKPNKRSKKRLGA